MAVIRDNYTLFDLSDEITSEQLSEHCEHLNQAGFKVVGMIDDVEMRRLIIVARNAPDEPPKVGKIEEAKE
jgi:hypothetical protein